MQNNKELTSHTMSVQKRKKEKQCTSEGEDRFKWKEMGAEQICYS